jgi:hypothetical protein
VVEYSPGYTSPSLYLGVGGSRLLVGWLTGNFRAFTAYRRYLLFSSGIAGVIVASFIRGPIRVLFKAPVMALACRLTIFWISWAQVFCPFHHSSAPYKAINWTAAIYILLTSPGARP